MLGYFGSWSSKVHLLSWSLKDSEKSGSFAIDKYCTVCYDIAGGWGTTYRIFVLYEYPKKKAFILEAFFDI